MLKQISSLRIYSSFDVAVLMITRIGVISPQALTNQKNVCTTIELVLALLSRVERASSMRINTLLDIFSLIIILYMKGDIYCANFAFFHSP